VIAKPGSGDYGRSPWLIRTTHGEYGFTVPQARSSPVQVDSALIRLDWKPT